MTEKAAPSNKGTPMDVTPEDRQVAKDLANHAMDRIENAIKDMMAIAGPSAPLAMYFIAGRACGYFLEGLSNFDLTRGRTEFNTTKAERVRIQAAITAFMVLNSMGNKTAGHYVHQASRGGVQMDGRELCRLLSQMQLDQDAGG